MTIPAQKVEELAIRLFKLTWTHKPPSWQKRCEDSWKKATPQTKIRYRKLAKLVCWLTMQARLEEVKVISEWYPPHLNKGLIERIKIIKKELRSLNPPQGEI